MGSAERALRRKKEQRLDKYIDKALSNEDKALEDFLNAIHQFVFMGVPREKASTLFDAAWNDAEKAQRNNPDARVRIKVDRLSHTGSWWGGE